MKTVFKKMSAIIVTLLMVFTLITPSQVHAAEATTVTLLHTNDVHCGIVNYDKVAAYKKAQTNPTLLLDMGDHIQGEIIGRITQGQKIVEIMNTAGYDIAIPGNHEFDYQVPAFFDVVDNANYTYLASNFRNADGSEIVTPGGKKIGGYEIKDLGGHKIGFVGVATPETYTKSTPKYFQDENGDWLYTFSEDTAEHPNRFYPTIQASIDAAKADGAELIVVMAHTGIESTDRAWAADTIIANLTGVDIYLDGHSHEEREAVYYPDKDGKDVYYQQTGTKTKLNSQSQVKNLGEVTITFTESGFDVSGRLINVPELTESDEATKAIIDQALKEVEDSYGVVVGHTDYFLTINDENGKRAVRNNETNMGDFNADAYRIIGESDIALVNGGGVRANLEAGDITRKALSQVNPFGNNVVTVKIDGQTILDALEHSYRNVPNENGGFFQVSGLELTIDADVESPVVLNEQGGFDHIDETKPRRVGDVKVGGEPIDPEKIYTVTGTTYILQQQGDGMTMFKDLEVVRLFDEPDSEFVERYLVEALNGEIPAEYDGIHGQGRITINHEWGEPTYEWSEDNKTVTAKVVCVNNETHVKAEETVETTVKVTKEPTCEDKGEGLYTATFENELFTEQSQLGEVDALGHKWGEWKTVKEATTKEEGLEERVCENDPEHKETRAIPKIKAGWNKTDDGWTYTKDDGTQVKDGWQKDKDKWYYFKDGIMKTGWVKDSGTWYYLKPSGAMVTGWQKISEKWYYFKSSGAMVTGWKKISGKWYYMNGSGVMQKNKWIDTYYYVENSGAMAVNKWIGKYHVNASGKWDKTR